LLRHTGTYVFDFAAQEPLYKALHEMAIANGTATQVVEAPVADAVIAEPKVLSSNEKKPAAKKKSKAA
jgi:hypothetical protein